MSASREAKGVAVPTPPAQPSPTRPPPPPAADEESDGEPPPCRPELPLRLRAERRLHAGQLLEVMLGKECRRHLLALHAGDVPSWRRDAFGCGGRRQLLYSSSLGDLESYPELANRARREMRKLVDSLEYRKPTTGCGLYAEEVLAPEAMLFAISALSGEECSVAALEKERALGAARFRT